MYFCPYRGFTDGAMTLPLMLMASGGQKDRQRTDSQTVRVKETEKESWSEKQTDDKQTSGQLRGTKRQRKTQTDAVSGRPR